MGQHASLQPGKQMASISLDICYFVAGLILSLDPIGCCHEEYMYESDVRQGACPEEDQSKKVSVLDQVY